MSRPWIAPLYGYLVCIISVIVFLMSASNLIDAIFDRANPLGSRSGGFGPDNYSLTSFEAYRATQERAPARTRDRGDTSRADTLSTADQRAQYEALRADRINRVGFDATKRMVSSALLILISLALFLWHWRWLRTQRETAAA